MYWSRKISNSDWEVRVIEANGTMEARICLKFLKRCARKENGIILKTAETYL